MIKKIKSAMYLITSTPLIIIVIPIYMIGSIFIGSRFLYQNTNDLKFRYPVVIYVEYNYPSLPDKYFINNKSIYVDTGKSIEDSMKLVDLKTTSESYIKSNLVFSNYYVYDVNNNKCKRIDRTPDFKSYSCFGGDSSCKKDYENIIYNNYFFAIPQEKDIKKIKANYKTICNINNELNEYNTKFTFNSQYIEN